MVNNFSTCSVVNFVGAPGLSASLSLSIIGTASCFSTHVQDEPTNNQELAAATLLGRFLPLAIAQDDPLFREMAIRCANECEAWARAIREYAGLGTSPALTSTVRGRVNHPHHELQQQAPEFDSDDESVPFEEIDPSLEARKRQRRHDALGF